MMGLNERVYLQHVSNMLVLMFDDIFIQSRLVYVLTIEARGNYLKTAQTLLLDW